ncbi:MAG: hypothetical protein Q8N17_02715, partial [Burkholderiaceae bacterium]|nr:hypothetical protein [Burkholderiaceae bacterium]
MNWLWVILGAIGGALLLQQSGGLLLGAILGGMASRLSRSRRSELAFEKRLRGLEQRLARLEHEDAAVDAIQPAEAASVAAAAEPAPAIAPAEEPAAVQTPALPRPTHSPTPSKSAPTYTDPTWPREPNPWISRLLSGNLLAKAGVVLLFFGAASGLKMAADYGLFPPGVRLLLAALAGV